MNKVKKILVIMLIIVSISTINLDASSSTITKYSNGNIKTKTLYNGSKRTKKIEYTASGKKSMMYTFNSNGEIYTKYYYNTNGYQYRSYRYDSNGNKQSAYDYKTVNGQRVIVKKWSYTTTGKKSKYQQFYNTGKKAKLVTYDSNGRTLKLTNYDKYENITMVENFKNGRRITRKNYMKDSSNGACGRTIGKYNVLVSTYSYSNNKLIKKITYTYDNGPYKLVKSRDVLYRCTTAKVKNASKVQTQTYKNGQLSKKVISNYTTTHKLSYRQSTSYTNGKIASQTTLFNTSDGITTKQTTSTYKSGKEVKRVTSYNSPFGNKYKTTTSTYKNGKVTSTKTHYYKYQWPLETRHNFGRSSKDISYLGDGSKHNGQDFMAAYGSKIYSIGKGKVVTNSFDSDGYGWYVVIQQPNGDQVIYAHMKQKSKLKVGQSVKPGSLIGYVGSTGVSYSPHLHLEITSPNKHKYEPLQYLNKKM